MGFFLVSSPEEVGSSVYYQRIASLCAKISLFFLTFLTEYIRVLDYRWYVNTSVSNLNHYQIEYITQTSGVSPKLNFRKQMNMIFEA